MKQILIIEDELDIQELLRTYLEDAGYGTTVAGDGVAALSLFHARPFDLILLDLMLPKIDGFGVCEVIRQQSQIPIIMLTALDSEDQQLKGFGMDIDDYVTKPFSIPVLLEKVRVILRRRGSADEERCLRYRDLSLNLDTREALLEGHPLNLTAREFELLHTFLAAPGRVFTREILLAKLWGYDFYGDERVVDSHIKNLRHKLERDYIETIRGVGYRAAKEDFSAFDHSCVLDYRIPFITFGFIAWVAPSTYTAVMNDDLAAQVDVLVKQLADTEPEDCGKLLDKFTLSSGATAILTGSDGHLVDTGAQIEVQTVYEAGDMLVTTTEGDSSVSFGTIESSLENTVAITMSEQSTIATEVHFAGQEESYTLYITPRLKAENVAVRALVQMAPWLLLVLITFSLLCAFFYSRYITRPIVRMSDIAGKMAELDFHWECGETRRDEIGQLGRSLDAMAGKLSTALTELESANQSLRGEVERERELDRQRMAFFNAASHELKTPVTILKGQLTGMLEGIGVYQNRDRYLLRSLQVTGRMENLVREMLTISRMEAGAATMKQESVELSALIEEQLKLDAGLLEQRGQHLVQELTQEITVIGDATLLGKVLGNLISNASLYSLNGAEIRVWCGWQDGCPAVLVENMGAHIGEDALPHLYEAFYREECSRNRTSGGSGLGLYLVKMILDRHGAMCSIKNTECGVQALVRFAPRVVSGLTTEDVMG